MLVTNTEDNGTLNNKKTGLPILRNVASQVCAYSPLSHSTRNRPQAETFKPRLLPDLHMHDEQPTYLGKPIVY